MISQDVPNGINDWNSRFSEVLSRLEMSSHIYLAAVAGVLLFTSCTALPEFFKSERGVPLEQFSAINGRYFPPFIEKFFVSTSSYYTDYPSLAEAQADLRLIEVKQLTDGKTPLNEANLSWSADGVYLGYEIITDRERKILLKDLVGNYSREVFIVPNKTTNFLEGLVARSILSYNAGLRWSQDSTRYAFMSNGGIGEYNIYVGAVGVKEKVVTTSSTKDGYATWSPKTNEIAFVSSRTGKGDIYLLGLDDNKLVRLSSGTQVDIFPEWVPNGKKLVYASGDAMNHDLMVLQRSAEGQAWGEPYKLTNWPEDDLRPTVSPDGRFVAFYGSSPVPGSAVAKSWSIYVVPLIDGRTYSETELRSMAVAKNVVIDLNTGPAWTPDSRKIFYVAEDPSNFNPIYGYDLFSGKRFMLQTATKMNRDILLSRLGVLSFRAQVGAWDRVFLALTNQGTQLQHKSSVPGKIHYLEL
jgi:Tol biopolymer transport system component